MSAAQPGSQCHAALGESIGTGQTVDSGQLKDHIGTTLDSPGGTVPCRFAPLHKGTAHDDHDQ